MFAGRPLQPSNSSFKSTRSTYIRPRSASPQCHPTQVARAMLLDTKGTIYLPMHEEPLTLLPVSRFIVTPALKGNQLNSTLQQPPYQADIVVVDNTTFDRYQQFHTHLRRIQSPGDISDEVKQFSQDTKGHRRSARVSCSPFLSLELESMVAPSPTSSCLRARSPSNESLSDSTAPPRSTNENHMPNEIELSWESPGTIGSLDGNHDAFSSMMSTNSEPQAAGYSTLLDTQLSPHIGLDGQEANCFWSSEASTEFHPQSHFVNPFAESLDTTLERQSSGLSDISTYLRPNAFSGHRDTLARLCFGPRAITSLPSNILSNVLGHVSFDDYKNMRLVSRAWLESLPVPHLRPSCHLPTEVLHQVFALLQPCDFDAARHTCRSWFIVSLDRRLGRMMAKKAGCQAALQADLDHCTKILYKGQQERLDEANLENEVSSDSSLHEAAVNLPNEDWLIAKRLATESRLSPAWHGSGIGSHELLNARFSIDAVIDFSEVLLEAGQDMLLSRKFSMSACGKFLLLMAGCEVIVYSIGVIQASMTPVVKLVAESNVLATSMDTSCHRYTVAALLEGRVGVYWDIESFVRRTQGKADYAYTGSVSKNYASPTDASGSSLPRSETCSSRVSDITASSEGLSQRLYNLPSIPTLSQATAVYENLGTARDPPRSVAICPQRRCVAFGRKSGIQLFWVDASTGKNLSRWFPLAAHSDHLFFLPGTETGKKLRLISSAASPLQRSQLSDDISTSNWSSVTSVTGRGRKRSMARLFSGNLPYVSDASSQDHSGPMSETGSSSASGCDHYQAVPLSDGIHMLFTDPVTGFLCLGSDAPLGGPTKLIRKVCMVPPSKNGTIPNAVPIKYVAGHDLRWGVRVVAAYDDGSIILYNIPSDCFEKVRHVRSDPSVWDDFNGVFGESDLLMDFLMQTRNVSDESSSVSSFRSVLIDGALIGHSDSPIEDVAIDSSAGGLKLWAFHANGKATHMDIYAPANQQIRFCSVDSDGQILDDAHSTVVNSCMGSERFEGEESVSASVHIRFIGLDGCCDNTSMCGPVDYGHEPDKCFLPLDEGISMTPPDSDSDDEEDPTTPQQIELLTDWCRESLLRPYIVNVPDIKSH